MEDMPQDISLLHRRNMHNLIFRIDDIGASTKHFNQHGKRWFYIAGKKAFYFPLADFWFFKRIPPFRKWAKYNELTVEEWKELIAIFDENKIVPVIAVTACWVEKDGTLTPFPEKFPEEANYLKEMFHAGKIVIANHGLTHCVLGKHLPKFWGSNRKYHREFLPELDAKTHEEHIQKSQQILEKFFEHPIEILVPPGNIWSIKTYGAMRGTNLKRVLCNQYMADSNAKMEGITFENDKDNSFAFHDRELKLFGAQWLRKQIKERLQ